MKNRIKEEDYKLLQKELKESPFVIVCTKKCIWLYGGELNLQIGILKIVKEFGEKIK